MQPPARPYPGQPFIPGGPNGPMQGGIPPNMGGPMRGPPGPHGYQRMRPPRGAAGGIPAQNYSMPRGAPRGQPYYMPQQPMYPGAYGMGPPGVPPYMGGGPMPGYPGPGGMGMGINHMPPPHAHTAHAAPPPQQREKKVLLIVDPKSGKPINAGAASTAASTASSTPATSTAPSTPSKPTETAVTPPKEQPPQQQTTTTHEAPKPASPVKKTAKNSTGTPGAGQEMLAKARALLAGKSKEEVEASVPTSAEPTATAKSPAPKPESPKKPVAKTEPQSPKKSVTKSEPQSPKKPATKSEPESPKKPASKSEPVVAQPSQKKEQTSASPKKKTPVPTPVASPVAKQTKTVSPKKKVESPKKKAESPLKKESIPAQADDVKTPVVEAPPTKAPAESTVQGDVNSVAVTANGKVTYTREVLLRFREMYTELPEDAKEGDLKWPAMDVVVDGTVRSRGPRAGSGGGGPGWERGNEKPGLNRQSSRSSNGGGGQWQRSQDVPKRGRSERGGRGGRGGRGAPEPLFDGPVKPLERTENRWIPVKAASTVEAARKKVQSIMNKMTREKFDKLAGQITEINMDSLEMLQAVIKLLFDKALGEPHFCDMYADLCVHLDQNWKVWSFLKIVRNEDDEKFYWTTMGESDSEVVGPFEDINEALESASSDEFTPVNAPEGLKLHDVRVRDGKFVKLWLRELPDDGGNEYFWSGQLLEDLGDDQVLNGPFESHELASRFAIKTCSFKRILLNACQEEFEKDNIYEELEEKYKKDLEEGTLSQEDKADYEEKRIIMKGRMLGNIRFIGELYRKGMLQERIMHECIMKLMGVKPANDTLEPANPNNAPDEESVESLCKLLATMGKDLESKSPASAHAMGTYFAYLERKMVKDKRLSSRIIFMIRDTIDLRANKWQPRRKELQSKSLNEIRKEAEREQRAPPSSAPPGRPDAFRMDSRRSNSSRDGGFSQRSTMPPVYQSQSMSSRSGNANKMQLPDRRNIQRDDSVKTGPQGRPASFGSGAARRAPTSAGPVLGKKSPGGVTGRGSPSAPKLAKDGDRSSSPAVAPLSDDDKEKITKKSKSLAEEYVSIVDLGEADACVAELQKEFKSHPEVSIVIASEILKLAIEAKVDIQRPMFDLLEKLSVEKGSLSFEGIRAGIKDTIELGNDLWCDVPKLHEHLAGFIARFAKVAEKSGVTLDWLMCDCVETLEADIYEELIQGGFLAEVCGCVLKLLKDANVDKAKAQVRETQVTLLSLFPDFKQTPKDFKHWIDKHEIGEALALQPAVDFGMHWIKSKDLQETVEWYQKTVPEAVKKDPVFSTLACLFVIGNLKKGELPSGDEGMLLNGLCVSVESQTRLVAGLFQTIGAVEDDADSFKALLKHLVKVEHAIPGLALTKWLELKNDNSVGRKRALAAFGDFVEELSKTK